MPPVPVGPGPRAAAGHPPPLRASHFAARAALAALALCGGHPCVAQSPSRSIEAVSILLRIDKKSCQSSGRCVAEEPTGFSADEDYLGDVKPEAGDLPLERLRAVARNCPALAIALESEAGEEIDF